MNGNETAHPRMFLKCPLPERCRGEDKNGSISVPPNITGCATGTDESHPLCAVCQHGWIKSGTNPCVPCSASNLSSKIGPLAGFAFSVLLLFVMFRKLTKKHWSVLKIMWADILRIMTTIISFCQISTSMPAVINKEDYPTIFHYFIEIISFVKFDIF